MADKKAEKEEKKTETPEEPKKKSGGTLKLILMIGLPIVLLQMGLAYFLISKAVHVPSAEAETKANEAEEDAGESGKLHVIEDVIVNPVSQSSIRFLNVTVALEFTESALEQEMAEKDVQLRDILISILAAKTIPELDGPEDKEALREEILTKCNAILKNGRIRKVYFSNFVMQ